MNKNIKKYTTQAVFYVILVLSVLLLTGCYSTIIKYNITENGECIIKCNNIMQEKWCDSVTVSHQSQNIQSIVNDYITSESNVSCQCVLLNCIWK